MLKKIIIISFSLFTFFNLTGQSNKRQLSLKDTIRDQDIQIPEDIERNLDQLLVDWKKNYFQLPSCDQNSSSDIVYSDSVYVERLYTYPSEMELVYNPIVRSYIDMYASRRRTSVQYMLAKGEYYFPMIEETLDKYGLPLELKYLPIIESALNPIAVSRAGATGLWQFMLRTGKMYDLEVNSLVDERRDPIKATEAAARYLKDLYDIYSDWNLVIAAYNCGPGNVNKAIKRSGGATDYWAIYPYLPRETRGYVPAFIAATYIMNFHSNHNICPLEYTYPVSVDTLTVDKTLHFKQVADVLNMSVEDIRALNPQYKKDIIPGDREYALCLPSKFVTDFMNNKDTIFSHNQNYLTHRKTVDVEDAHIVSGKATKYHKIKRGESLGTIAKKYGVSIAHLKRVNNLRSDKISAGKSLVINRTAPAAKKVQSQPVVVAQQVEHKEIGVEEAIKENNIEATEVPQDSISTSNDFFADYYKSKNDDTETNTVSDDLINDSLDVAQDESMHTIRTQIDDNKTIYHKVKIGETLPFIAKKYDVTAVEILSWNNLPSKKIQIGQRLKIRLPENTDLSDVSGKEITQEEVAKPTTEEEQTVSLAEKRQEQKTINTKKIVYRVRKGDSLHIIAKRYRKVTPQDIILANNLKSDKLSIGQELEIPIN